MRVSKFFSFLMVLIIFLLTSCNFLNFVEEESEKKLIIVYDEYQEEIIIGEDVLSYEEQAYQRKPIIKPKYVDGKILLGYYTDDNKLYADFLGNFNGVNLFSINNVVYLYPHYSDSIESLNFDSQYVSISHSVGTKYDKLLCIDLGENDDYRKILNPEVAYLYQLDVEECTIDITLRKSHYAQYSANLYWGRTKYSLNEPNVVKEFVSSKTASKNEIELNFKFSTSKDELLDHISYKDILAFEVKKDSDGYIDIVDYKINSFRMKINAIFK